MATKFSDILKAIASRFSDAIQQASKQSFSWFMNRARKLRQRMQDERFDFNLDETDKQDKSSLTRIDFLIGQMILFKYDPKWKEKLPYYDIYPLIFPIQLYKDGFLGINMHYLPYRERAVLMDALYTLLNDKTQFDENSRLRISYQILKGASKFQNYKPCVKRYLFSHLRSRWKVISIEEWDIALFLPLQKFQKASETTVWRDSMKKIRGKP